MYLSILKNLLLYIQYYKSSLKLTFSKNNNLKVKLYYFVQIHSKNL